MALAALGTTQLKPDTLDRMVVAEPMGLLLGAGASYELGMPLISHITEQLRGFYNPRHLHSLNKLWTKKGAGYGDALVKQTADLLQRRDLHYENVLGFLQTEQRRLGQDQDKGQRVHGMYLRLVESVYALLYERQTRQTRYLSRALIPYEGILSLVDRAAPLHVFSLNHDLMIELLAEHLGIPLADGFWPTRTLDIPNVDERGRARSGLIADIITEEDLSQNNLHVLEPGQRGINLFKLHGALDVFALRDGTDLCRLRPVSGVKQGRLAALRIANEELGFWDRGGQFRVANEIVYTDSMGQSQFLRRTLLAGAQKFNKRYDQTLPHRMLELFKFRIQAMNELYVIGYSFGDYHVDQILREWLELLTARRMVIVDPFRPSLPTHFGHLAQQISLVRKRTGDFLGERRLPALTKAQRLEQLVRHRLRPAFEARITKRIVNRGNAA